MIKRVVMIRRRPGMAVADFQAYWLGEHPRLVTRLPGLVRYVQSHTLPGVYRHRQPLWDGIVEVWFASAEARRALRGTPELAAVEADEARFIDRAAMRVLDIEEHVVVDGDWPRPGVKSIEFIRRREGMARDAFDAYWRDVHGPLAAGIPQLRRYVQNHLLPAAWTSGREPVHDGLAITWFDDRAALRAAAETDAYRATRDDEPNFLTVPSPVILATEHVILA
ncbi:MAG: EthD family reductase [Alphaproteobacteria bacterium]